MDSEEHVMPMQQGKKPGYAIARKWQTGEVSSFFWAWSAIKHLMIQEVNWQWDELLALIQITLRLATFVIPTKQK